MFVDLHCHSTASDGECPPADLPRRAHAAGLAAVALTDHDTLAGVAAAEEAGRALGVRVVPGCEFSVVAPWGEMHLLGYYLPSGHAALDAFLQSTRDMRSRRGERMVERLHQAGVDIAMAEVAAEAAGGAIGRPHVARALVRRGHAVDVPDAFARFLSQGRPAYVGKELPELEEVIRLIRGVGGLAVAAHLGDQGTERRLKEFAGRGLDGVEVRHPRHDAAAQARLLGIAERVGLAVSGGSDWHGDGHLGSSHAPLGGMQVPADWLDALDRRRAAAAKEAPRV